MNGKGEASELTDLNRPQGTNNGTREERDEKSRKLLAKFSAMTVMRAALQGAGGIVGLWTALAL